MLGKPSTEFLRSLTVASAALLAGLTTNVAPAAAEEPLVQETAQLINNIRQRLDVCGEEGLLGLRGAQPVSLTVPKARPTLNFNARLAAVASGHAKAMAEQSFFDHVDPEGRSVGHRATAGGYRWRVVGENLAAGQQSIGDAMRGWLMSTSHCNNLIDERFTEFGIAKVRTAAASDPYGTYWVLVLGRPRTDLAAVR